MVCADFDGSEREEDQFDKTGQNIALHGGVLKNGARFLRIGVRDRGKPVVESGAVQVSGDWLLKLRQDSKMIFLLYITLIIVSYL